jgi:hypothetical protein
VFSLSLVLQIRQLMQLPEFDKEMKDLPYLPSGMNANGWFEERHVGMIRVRTKEYILRQATAFYEKHGALQDVPIQPKPAGCCCYNSHPAIYIISQNAHKIFFHFDSFRFLFFVVVQASIQLLQQQNRGFLQPHHKARKSLGKALKAANAGMHHTQKRGHAALASSSDTVDENENVGRLKKKKMAAMEAAAAAVHGGAATSSSSSSSVSTNLPAAQGGSQIDLRNHIHNQSQSQGQSQGHNQSQSQSRGSWASLIPDAEAFDVFGGEDDDEDDYDYEEGTDTGNMASMLPYSDNISDYTEI